MWRKLTSLLFNEEEIIIEEEEVEVEEISIKPIEPLTQKTIEIDVLEKANLVDAFEPKVDHKVVAKAKKSIMIDFDNADQVKENTKTKEPKKVISIKPPVDKSVYKSKNIISPYHGGTILDENQEIEIKKKSYNRRETVTKVISPIYGNVHDTEKDDEAFEALTEKFMGINLENMIDDEKTSDEEIQTSLFDFLEGIQEDE